MLSLKRGSTTGALLSVVSVIAVIFAPQLAGADTYISGGTVVFKENGQAPQADKGAVICDPHAGAGIGGGCIPFSSDGQPAAISVTDLGVDLIGAATDVAFQVCIDNNGDYKCTSGGGEPGSAGKPCADFVAFSHDDAGRFFNPLGPLPSSKSPGCEGSGGWDGYVVFICDGVHVNARGNVPAHSHPATTGAIGSVDPSLGQGSPGFGDFCGGTRELVVEKDYQVVLAP